MDLRSVKRILVPTDFSDPSAEALGTAIALAKEAGAAVDLVHVAVEASFALPPPIDVATVPIDMARVMERVTDGLRVEEARVRAAGLHCETAMLVGRPDAEIVARATATGAELIVMGTHGRSGLAHALLGSVAERVVQHSLCPVLIVPKRDSSSAAR
jgi:nucleotide-binding universal stress UspA family protein